MSSTVAFPFPLSTIGLGDIGDGDGSGRPPGTFAPGVGRILRGSLRSAVCTVCVVSAGVVGAGVIGAGVIGAGVIDAGVEGAGKVMDRAGGGSGFGAFALCCCSCSCRARTAANASCGFIGPRCGIVVIELEDGVGTGNGRLRVVSLRLTTEGTEFWLDAEADEAIELWLDDTGNALWG